MGLFRKRPRPHGELIDRQLLIFAEDNAELRGQLDDALAVHRRASKADAEESFGDAQDVANEGRDALERIRESFATTLPEGLADEYRVEFDRTVVERYPDFALELDVWARDDD
jgi:hypothetical protein